MRKLLLPLFMIALLLLVLGCPSGAEDDQLTVYFANETASSSALTELSFETSLGVWSDSIIPSGETLEPGRYVAFTLSVPNGESIHYRVKIEGQATYEIEDSAAFTLTILHWATHVRNASVTVGLNSDSVPRIIGQSDTSWDNYPDTFTEVDW